LAAYRQSDYAQARTLGEAALTIKLARNDPDELTESYNALGLVAVEQARLLDALDLYERARVTARQAGDTAAWARATGNVGLARLYLGEFDSARTLLSEMRQLSKPLKLPRYEGNALANLGMLDIWEGRPRDGIAKLTEARKIYAPINYVPGEQNALGQLATAYLELGDYGAAFSALDSSLALARAKTLGDEEVEILRLMASLRAQVGDLRLALRTYRDADSLAASRGLDSERGSVLRSTASLRLDLADPAGARRDALAALAIHRRTQEKLEELDDHLALAEIDARDLRRAASTTHLTLARALADSVGTRSARTAVAMSSARIADRANDPTATLEALRRASGDIFAGDYAAEEEMYALQARAFLRVGQLDSSVAAGTRAIAAIERSRTTLGLETDRRTLLADRSATYANQVIALLRLGRDRDAFMIADRARSRGLIESIASTRDSVARPSLRDVGESERLLRVIDKLLQQLKSIDSVPARDRTVGAESSSKELLARIDAARTAYEAHLARTALRTDDAGVLLGTAQVPLARVQASLGEGEALVEYLVARDRVIVFVLTRSALRTLQVNDVSAIAERVRVVREVWGDAAANWRLGIPASQALYRTLFSGLRTGGYLDGVRRLLIVPHGILSQVPFAALVIDTSPRWLGDDFEIAYLPSAAALLPLRTRAVASEPSTAVAFAPFPQSLPATASEAGAVARSIPHATEVVGAAATERAVRSALGSTSIVHVATHGVLNAANPLFSRLELASSSKVAHVASNDGRLEVHELISLGVKSSLVFLSGCETSAIETWLDDPVRGAQHTTLAQALLFAGAGNVVGTLWRIDDAGAAAFAEQFYASLRTEGPITAMATAQRALARGRQYANPHYWASYLLVGVGYVQP
jgi:CHAT domain-containing protein